MYIREDKTRAGGFTLAELLIVVAIIAVLVAIAIPVFTKQLERSREATDMSNVRSAVSELYYSFMTYGPADDPQSMSERHWITLPNGASYGAAQPYVTIVRAVQTMPDWQGTRGEVNLRVDGDERTYSFDAATVPGWYLIEIDKYGNLFIRPDSSSSQNTQSGGGSGEGEGGGGSGEGEGGGESGGSSNAAEPYQGTPPSVTLDQSLMDGATVIKGTLTVGTPGPDSATRVCLEGSEKYDTWTDTDTVYKMGPNYYMTDGHVWFVWSDSDNAWIQRN